MADLAQPPAQRQMAGSFFARRKMVVIPTFGRDKQASRLPIDAHHFVFSAGIPHHRIALTGDDDDLSTRPVPVSFLVGARFDGHDVTDHRITGKMDTQPAEADATLRVRIECDCV